MNYTLNMSARFFLTLTPYFGSNLITECRVTDDSNGVIVQAAGFLFDRIGRDNSSTYTLRVTCVEVYNEQVISMDL